MKSGMPEHVAVRIRAARAEEFDRIGDLRVAAYRADGFLSEASTYAETLRVLGMDGTGEILAAVDGERLLGTVMLVTWPHGGVLSHPAHPRPGRQATYGWPDSLVIGRPAACQPIMPSATLLASQPAPASACAAWSDR